MTSEQQARRRSVRLHWIDGSILVVVALGCIAVLACAGRALLRLF